MFRGRTTSSKGQHMRFAGAEDLLRRTDDFIAVEHSPTGRKC